MPSLILIDLSLRDVLTDVPHDAAAIVVYLMIALFVGVIWAGSRPKGRTARGGKPPR